jgi:hypothetical protein
MSINKLLDQTISLKLIILIGGFWIIVGVFVFFLLFGGVKEGFKAGIAGLGTAIDYSIGDGVKQSWENKDVMQTHLDTDSINENDNIYSHLEKNEGGLIPLPNDELLFFKDNKFSPDCCPSDYSSSDGCLCAAPEQMKYLNERGGNRTLSGEF